MTSVIAYQRLKCPYCGSTEIVNDGNGFYVCSRCGSVVDRVYDYSSIENFRQTLNVDGITRVSGRVTNLIDNHGIGFTVYDGDPKLFTLQSLVSRNSPRDREIYSIFLETIKLLNAYYKIPSYVADEVARNFRKFYEIEKKKIHKKDFYMRVTVALVYYFMKLYGFKLDIKDVLNKLRLSRSKFWEGLRAINEVLKLKPVTRSHARCEELHSFKNILGEEIVGLAYNLCNEYRTVRNFVIHDVLYAILYISYVILSSDKEIMMLPEFIRFLNIDGVNIDNIRSKMSDIISKLNIEIIYLREEK